MFLLQKVKDKTCLRMVEKVKTSLSGGIHNSGETCQVTQKIGFVQVTQDAVDLDVLHDSNRTYKPTDQKEEGNVQNQCIFKNYLYRSVSRIVKS